MPVIVAPRVLGVDGLRFFLSMVFDVRSRFLAVMASFELDNSLHAKVLGTIGRCIVVVEKQEHA